MGTGLRPLDSETSAMDVPGREVSVRARAGRTLRHWTTNDLAFMGKATTTASGAGDWGLADARRRSLVASKLRSFAAGVGEP